MKANKAGQIYEQIKDEPVETYYSCGYNPGTLGLSMDIDCSDTFVHDMNQGLFDILYKEINESK